MDTKYIRNDDLGEIFRVNGVEIFVNEYNVGRVPDASGVVGPHGPSDVDYYYSERGYGARNAQEVAAQFYRNFYA